MKKILTRSYVAYTLIIAGILSLVLAIVGPITHGFAAQSFSGAVIALAIVALVVDVFAFAVEWKWAPLLAAVISAAVFAVTLYNALPIYADHFNDLNFQNGVYGACVAYVVIAAIACLCNIVACFDPKK